jgi:glycosyltransferase involved in cell wall biosynthesis
VTVGEPAAPSQLRLVILIPVYNDWPSADLLLRQIDSVCAESGLTPAILLVNDGSTLAIPEDFLTWKRAAICKVDVLELYMNLGHQRAICVALVYACQDSPGAAVLVMDADGEDRPDQIPLLIKTYHDHQGRRAIFAARRRRTEGIAFKILYHLYRLLHLTLVGTDIHIGNFSVLPPDLVERLVRSSDLWNHYAACAIKSKLPLSTVPIDRGKRLLGRSQMRFTSLVLHGLSAMSVYSDVIGIRVLVLAAVFVLLGLAAMVSMVLIRAIAPWDVAGWATTAFGTILILVFQVAVISLLFTFGVLASRGGQSFIPVRDCPHFVLGARSLDSTRG